MVHGSVWTILRRCPRAALIEVSFGEGDHLVQSITPPIAKTIMIARITCNAANRIGIHRSMVVTAL